MQELVIVQLNDLHGYLAQHPEWVWGPDGLRFEQMGSIARIKAMVDAIRKQNPHVLFLDNGDTFHGTRAVVESRGECMLPIMERLGLAAMTGHWEFAYGPEHLTALSQALPYPFLAANVYEKDGDRLVFPPVTRVHFGATRVGIMGLACNIVDKVMPPHFSEGIRFTDGIAELPRYVDQLRNRERCDLVVLLSHLGLPQDLDLVSRVEGVDVCLSAHTHHRLEAPVVVNKTIVIQSGCHGSFLGVLRLGIKPSEISMLEHRLVPVTAEIEPDPQIEALVERALATQPDDSTTVVGTCPVPLSRAMMLESTADNVLLDAMREATGTELSFINGWRYGAPIPAGPITVEAIYNLVPMNPEISTVRLSGAELWDMLEENLERTFSREPFAQMGGYVKRCGGLKAYFKVENPKGSRLQALFVGKSRVDPARHYTASFVTMQAVPGKYGSDRQGTGMHLVETVVSHLQKGAAQFGPRQPFMEL